MLNISMAVMWIGRQVRCKLPPLLFSQVSSAHRLLTFWTQFRSVRHTLDRMPDAELALGWMCQREGRPAIGTESRVPQPLQVATEQAAAGGPDNAGRDRSTPR